MSSGGYSTSGNGSSGELTLPEVGTIINDQWNSLAAWTKVGAQTFTIDTPNTLTVRGGAPGSVTLSNYYTSNYGPTNYTNWETSFLITVGTISASSYGVGFGTKSTNSFFESDFIAGILLDSTNKGHLALYANGSNTPLKTTVGVSKALTVAAGNILQVTIKRLINQIQITIVNTSTAPKNSISLIVTKQEFGATSFIPNIGNFAIYALGGAHVISPLTVTVHQKIGSAILVIGDSRVFNNSASNEENGFPGLLNTVFSGNVDVYGGSGNRNQDYTASEILTLAPSNIIILSGTNNQADGDTAATTATKLQTFISALTGYTLGTNLFYLDELPKGSADMATYSSQYRTTIGTAGCIYIYQSFLASTGTGPIVKYFNVDLLHPVNNGHQLLTDIMCNQLPSTIDRLNYPKYYSSKAFFTEGSVSTLHLSGFSQPPTIAAGSGAGTGPTVSLPIAKDLCGVVNVTTGTTPGASAVVVTITFSVPYGAAPQVILMPNNAATALLTGVTQVYATSSTTTFVINAGSTGLTASTAYQWYYLIVQ
jgi:hypothetical protein